MHNSASSNALLALFVFQFAPLSVPSSKRQVCLAQAQAAGAEPSFGRGQASCAHRGTGVQNPSDDPPLPYKNQTFFFSSSTSSPAQPHIKVRQIGRPPRSFSEWFDSFTPCPLPFLHISLHLYFLYFSLRRRSLLINTRPRLIQATVGQFLARLASVTPTETLHSIQPTLIRLPKLIAVLYPYSI